MRWPMEKFQLQSGYQFTDWSPSNTSYHPGSDMNYGSGSDDLGMPVFSCMVGIVDYVQYSTLGYGNMVVINHYNGTKTKYAHLKEIFVTKGQKVHTFMKIGSVGSTGSSTAPHLHFEIHKKDNGLSNTFYPNGKSKQFVIDHYYDPEKYIQPKKLSVIILANRCNFPSWQKKIDDTKKWYKEKSFNQLELDISLLHIDIDAEWAEYELSRGKKTWLLDGEWVNSKLMPLVKDKDICIFAQKFEDYWPWNEALAYAAIEEKTVDMNYLGVEFIAMRAADQKTDMWGRGGDFTTNTLKHEIMHTLIQMHNRHSHRKIDDRVHEFDLHANSTLEQAMNWIEIEALIGFNHPKYNRLFKRDYKNPNRIIMHELLKDPMFDETIKGFYRAGFTNHIK